MIQLGQEVKCKVTGYTGIAVVQADHLFGCVRIGVKPQERDKDGRLQDAEYFDEVGLEVVSDGVMPTMATEEPSATPKNKRTGGPDRERPGREHY